jgi:hypothetical protein
MAECDCGAGIKNTGIPSCVDIFDTMNIPWFSKKKNNSAVKNSIDLSGGVYDQTFFEALVNEADNSSRWFPVKPIENHTWTQNDPEEVTTTTGNTFVTRDGNVTVVFELWDVPATYYKKFKSTICPEMQFVFADVAGNLVGDASEAFTGDILKGIPIQKGSMKVLFFPKQDGGRSMMRVTFTIPHTFEVGDINFIAASAMTYDVNDITGLIDVNGTVVGTPTTTGFVVDLKLDYGTATEPIVFEGGVVANFTLAEVTPTPGAITITSVTESLTVDGRYTFVIPTATSGDVLRLSLAKTGYEMTPVTVTIP